MSKEKIIDIFKKTGALLDGHFVFDPLGLKFSEQ